MPEGDKDGTRRVEVNPTEMFLVNPKTVLVSEWESVFAAAQKIGVDNKHLTWLGSFTGKINNTDEIVTYTLALSPEEAFALMSKMIDQFEWLTEIRSRAGGSSRSERRRMERQRRKGKDS